MEFLKLLSFSVFIFYFSASSGQPLSEPRTGENLQPLYGNLLLDSQLGISDSQPSAWAFFSDEKKSPLKAAFFSAVIPGTGEWYAEAYKSAIGFFTAEIVLVGSYLYFDKDAANKEKAYQKVANDPAKGWSVRKYADYLIYWAEDSGGGQDQKAKDLAVALKNKINGDPNMTPGNREWWTELNSLEREMTFTFGGGAKFSHVLPGYDSQQYYELIGKYEQFMPGWYDYDNSLPMSHMQFLTPAFRSYRDSRTRANEMHNLASTFAVLTLVNHTVSAVNAAMQARLHTDQVKLSLNSLPTGTGYSIPALQFTLKI